MLRKQRHGKGKGPRSVSRIGRQYKSKLWRRKKLADREMKSDTDDKQSMDVPSDLEDVVNEPVSELDHSSMPTALVTWSNL